MYSLCGVSMKEETVILGREMMACTHKHDNSGISVVFVEEKLIQIGLIIVEITLYEI